MTFKRFIFGFVCAYFALLSLIACFNFVVDPGWYFRAIEVKGFNSIKPEFVSFERDIKPALLIRNQPEAIILGSSYSDIGLNPLNPFFTDHGRLKSMNFAFAKASWEEVQCDFEFAVTHAHIKRALVGFHPGDLPIADCRKDFASIGQFNPIDLLLSHSALDFSIKTIMNQDVGNASHTREGMFFYNRTKTSETNNRFKKDLDEQVASCIKFGKAGMGGDVRLDLSGLQRMIRLARAYGTELVLYAYPEHAFLLQLEYSCGRQEAKWQYMRQIAEVADAESGGRVHAWQFYDYNDMTAEKPLDTKAGYWQDAKHFNYEMGDMMLADMFDRMRDKPLLGQALGASYGDFLRRREEYLHRHPEFRVTLTVHR